jgi:DNA-binding GntR family transcriptional regulator
VLEADRQHVTRDEPADGAETDGRASLVDGAERAVRRWLRPGRFRRGDRLPPEQELAGMLGVSRGTLRSALRRLEESGEIVRRQGSGTFVGSMGAPRGVTSGTLRVDSYTMWTSTDSYSIRELRIEVGEVGEAAARALDLEPGTPATHLWRIVATGEAVTAVAEDVFHPSVPLPDRSELHRMLMEPMTSWDLLATTETPPAISSTRISSLLLTPDDELGAHLHLSDPTACLALEEVACSEHREPLLWSWDVLVPGGFELEVLQSAVTLRPDRVAGPGASGG